MRFVVEQQKSGAFAVKDTQAKVLKQDSDMAVCIFFKERDRAERVCSHLNAEWGAFLRNPS